MFCLSGQRAAAQTFQMSGPQAALLQPISLPSGYSSSNDVDALPAASDSKHSSASQAEAAAGQSTRPFSRLGMAVTGGSGGIGLQLATPLGDHFNLRASGSYFSYYLDFTTSGYNVTGRVLARQAGLSLDYFPFHNGFRISPGVTLDNANAVHGTIVIPGGQSFDLGDATYTSEVGAPISGNVALSFGKRVAPSFTLGWGNLIPHRPHRFSVPVEIGFEYIGAPQVNFNLFGYACDDQGNCYDITQDPGTQANVTAERTKINNDIYPLRFYPIASIGFGFTF